MRERPRAVVRLLDVGHAMRRNSGRHELLTPAVPVPNLGGHLEMHESWKTCAVREVKEETNLDLDEDKLRFCWVDNSDMPDEGKHYTTIFLVAELPQRSAPLTNMEPNKCESWEWMPWEDLRTAARAVDQELFIPLRNALIGGCDPGNLPPGNFSSDPVKAADTS
mmetsp:Transcript_45249/g.141824  ORF Transcript_45249/g.141824 Transcript_45249/m.141824 type:complete len:165 (-) Transcript_45249:1708-2202(-)